MHENNNASFLSNKGLSQISTPAAKQKQQMFMHGGTPSSRTRTVLATSIVELSQAYFHDIHHKSSGRSKRLASRAAAQAAARWP